MFKIIYLFFFTFVNQLFLVYTLPKPAKTCRDHYLNGHFDYNVLPLQDLSNPNSKIYNIECEFPQSNNQPQLTVNTIIHNGLEKILLLNSTEKKTVGYQISDWSFLRSTIKDSFKCVQELYIKWKNVESQNLELKTNDNNIQEFTIESIHGNRLHFTKNKLLLENFTKNYVESFELQGDSAGFLHIFPITVSNVLIQSSPLKCSQLVINNPKCLFNLFGVTDSLSIDIESGIKNLDFTIETISFSFRTDLPNSPFISLKTRSGDFINVDLIDGYLLSVNHIVHPTELLADGNWHRVVIDLISLTLLIDENDQGTVISLSTSIVNELETAKLDNHLTAIVELSIQLTKAQITAIQFGPKNYKETSKENKSFDNNWLCYDSQYILLKKEGLPLGEKQICSTNELEKSFCNCRGPNSVFTSNIEPFPASCFIEDGSKGFRFLRSTDRLTFFHVSNFLPKSSISLVFRSELDNGLLLFGTWTSNTPHSSSLPNALNEQSSRLQVHYVGSKLFAVFCSRLNNGSERCYSCLIKRLKGFATGEWLRLSFFSFDVYLFITLNEKICQLSPNFVVPEISQLYKVSNLVSNVLLIGGMYYAKTYQLNQKINDNIRRDYYDNTREKPLSFQGCIAEVRINGIAQNLENLIEQQTLLFAKNLENKNIINSTEIFGIEKTGCKTSCSTCEKAPCYLKKFQPFQNNKLNQSKDDFVCDCSALYLLSTADKKKCLLNAKQDMLDESFDNKVYGIKLSSTLPLYLNLFKNKYENLYSGNSNRQNKILKKMWFLLKLPTTNKEAQTFLELGPIAIQSALNGRKLIVNIEEFEVQEEFFMTSDDNRLNLLSIELNPSIGTAVEEKSLTIRVNNDIRTIQGIVKIPFYPLSDEWRIIPIVDSTLNENNNSEDILTLKYSENLDNSGCIAEFALNFAPDNDNLSFKKQQQLLNTDENYLTLFVNGILEDSKTLNNYNISLAKKNLLLKSPCGIRDSTLWLSNSSKWNLVSAYDPYGTSNYYGTTDEKKPLNPENSNFESSRTSSTKSPTLNGNLKSPMQNEKIIINDHLTSTPIISSKYNTLINDDIKSVYSSSDKFTIDDYSSSPKLANRRYRSKAAILLRRPPDPPENHIRIMPEKNNTSFSLQNINKNLLSNDMNISTITAPIAKQDED